MIFILILLLTLLIFISLYISDFDVISPWFISCLMYLISVIAVFFGDFSKDISMITVFAIVLGLLAFGFGELSIRLFFYKSDTYKYFSVPTNRINTSRITNVITIVTSSLILLWTYFEIKNIATSFGYIQGQHLLIQYARLGILQHNASFPMFLSLATFILRSLSYIYTFIFFHNRMLSRKISNNSKELYLLLPSFIYLLQYTLSGSRGAFIEYIAFVLILYCIFKIKSSKNRKIINFKIIRIALVSFVSFLLLFGYLGSFKGSAIENVTSYLSLYIGGSIISLDTYLNSYISKNEIFGEESLLGLRHIFYLFGIHETDSTRVLEFSDIGYGYSTNVYTSLRRYIQDFGFFGMLLIQFKFGFIINIFFVHIKRSTKINYLFVFYSIFFMTIVYQSIDDQFLVSFLSTTQVFTVLFTLLFYFLFFKKYAFNKNCIGY